MELKQATDRRSASESNWQNQAGDKDPNKTTSQKCKQTTKKDSTADEFGEAEGLWSVWWFAEAARLFQEENSVLIKVRSRPCYLSDKSKVDSQSSDFLISFSFEQYIPQYSWLYLFYFFIKFLLVLLEVLSKRVLVWFRLEMIFQRLVRGNHFSRT